MKASSVLWEGNFPSFVFIWFWLDIKQFEFFECNKLQLKKHICWKSLGKLFLHNFELQKRVRKQVGASAEWEILQFECNKLHVKKAHPLRKLWRQHFS